MRKFGYVFLVVAVMTASVTFCGSLAPFSFRRSNSAARFSKLVRTSLCLAVASGSAGRAGDVVEA